MLKYRLVVAIAAFILCPIIWFTSVGSTNNGGSSGAGFYYSDNDGSSDSDNNGSCESRKDDGSCGSGQANNVQGQVETAQDKLNENNPGENNKKPVTPAPIATPSTSKAENTTDKGADAGAAAAAVNSGECGCE
jgi:hypothetical protein